MSGSLSGSVSTTAASYNLTTLGTTDWAHWGDSDGVANGFADKASGGGKISNLTQVGSGGNYGTYNSAIAPLTWTDGNSSDASQSNDNNYVWDNGSNSTGWTFTAPADTIQRTLYVLAGGYGTSSTITASLSDGSAANFTDTESSSGLYRHLFTITYQAASANQTLEITFDRTSTIVSQGSADLAAAWLTTTTVPAAPSGLSATVASSSQVNLAWTSNSTNQTGFQIDQATNSTFTQNLTTVTTAANATSYDETGLSPNTTYYYRVRAVNSAGSSANTSVSSALTYNTGGALAGTVSAAASSYNLTSLGTTDWAHWGDSDSVANGFADKASGGGEISNVTKIGSGGNYGTYNSAIAPMTWTDGNSSDPSQSNDNNYIWQNGAVGAGWTFTVPADTTSRTLYIFAGGYGTASVLSAHLSDGSSADYTAPAQSSTGLYRHLYTITYQAASAGQTLTITLTKTQDLSGGTGSVDLAGAWLVASSSVPAISTNPANQTVTAGETATFTAAASGNPTPTVQWEVSTNGGSSFSNISGATSTTLNVPSTTAGENGYEYEAVFTNSAGSATTTPATLNVQYVPVVTTSPTNQTETAGQTATFTAVASGNPAPTVQWELSTNGGSSFSNISGATSTTLSVPSTTAGENGYEYEAVFTNSVGNATTAAATLNVQYAPVVTTNPTNQSDTAGQTATFTAAASGNPTPTVQWQVSTDGGDTFSNITGATSSTLTLSSVTTSQNGYEYQAVFTNSVSSTNTTAATLTVEAASGARSGTVSSAASSYNLTSLGTTDWAHWGDSDGVANGFADKASGGGEISNVTQIGSGGNYGTYDLSIAPMTWTDGNSSDPSQTNDNNYIWQNAAVGAGWTFTVPADTTSRTLYVFAGGYGTASVLSAHLSDGSSPDYTAPAQSSTGLYRHLYAITYQAASAGQTLTITLTKTEDLSGGSGSVDLAGAWLESGAGAPVITTQPISQNEGASQAFTLTAAASGSPAPSVQWQQSVSGGAFQNITGNSSATTDTLSISGITATTEYQAVFSNSGGTITTNSATETVVSNFDVVSDTTPESTVQTDLNNLSSAGGGTLQFEAGTYTYSEPLIISSNTTLQGAPNFQTQLNFPDLSASGPTYEGYPDVWALALAGNDQNVTITGLNITSNFGLVQMQNGSLYKNIFIEDNQFQFGAQGNTSYLGSDVYGINDSINTTDFEVTYNDWLNSPYSVRCWCITGGVSNSNFNNNLYQNVTDGGQLQLPGSNVSFNNNYATGLTNKLQEGDIDGASNFTADGNVAYAWASTNTSSMGLSLLMNSGTNATNWPVDVSSNYIQLALAGGAAGGTSGVVLELGGGPLTCSNNVLGAATAPSFITVNTPNATGTNNECFGPNQWGVVSEESGPGGTASWIGQAPAYNSNLSAMPAPPPNTFAGNSFYPGSITLPPGE